MILCIVLALRVLTVQAARTLIFRDLFFFASLRHLDLLV
jgi:hypothetical protein